MPVEPGRPGGAVRAAVGALLLAAAGACFGQVQPAPALLAACSGCHGPNGNSQVPDWPSIAGQPRIFIENQLVLIREGLREVPAMKAVMAGLSDEDIGALARHYAAQVSVPLPVTLQPDQRQRGAQLSRKALCATCHLPGYTGQNQVPRLAGQNEAYLRVSMKQFRDDPGPGRDTIMSATLLGMNDADLRDLAHYLASSRP